jgi:hypothetical protein
LYFEVVHYFVRVYNYRYCERGYLGGKGMRSFVIRLLYLVAGILFMTPVYAFSQSTAPAAPAAPAPADFPSYIVTPSEDLNPYDLSTMQKSTGIDYRKGAGTLGTTTERGSNIEINAALQKKREERLKAAQDAKTKSDAKEAAEEGGQQNSPQEITPSEGPQLGDSAKELETPGVRGGLFTWTDDQGVLHATNDIGQVPIKYQMEAIQSSNGVDLNKDKNNKKNNRN